MSYEWAHENAQSVMGSVKNLALVGFRDAPAPEDVRHWRAIATKLGRAYGEDTACLDLVVRGTPRFSDDLRTEVSRFASERFFHRGVAHVVLLPGFAGTAARSFISTVILVSRPPGPAKVFSDPAAACAWLQTQLGPKRWKLEELTAAYDALAAVLART